MYSALVSSDLVRRLMEAEILLAAFLRMSGAVLVYSAIVSSDVVVETRSKSVGNPEKPEI